MLPIDMFLVRHGESEGNAAKRRSEAGDHSVFTQEFRERHNSSFRLSEKGREQADLAGNYICHALISPAIDRYYVSSYLRAIETAARLGIPNAQWRIDPYITERDWGDLDNLPEDERQEKFGAELIKREVEPFFWRPPNGEHFNALCLRIDRFLDTLHRECSDKRVVVVCHGEVMRAFQVRLERLSQEEFRRRTFSTNPSDRIHHCQIAHYTRRDPDTESIRPYCGWTRWVRPAEEGSQRSSGWQKILRQSYSNQDLTRLVEKVPPMVQ